MNTEPITFTVPAVPVSSPRKRTRVVAKFAQHYTPTDSPVNAYKASCRKAFTDAYQGAPLSGPLSVDVVFVFPRTSNQIWKRKPMVRIRHDKKPDRDNLDKSTLDALKNLAWRDDAQVCDGRIQKWIAAGDEQPHVEITITPLTPENQ